MKTRQYNTSTHRPLIAGCLLLALLLVGIACEPWDLDRLDFLKVSTLEAEAVTAFSAKLRGRIEGLNVGRVSEHGHLWSRLDDDPQLGDTDVTWSSLGGADADGDFVSELFPVDTNSVYYYRAYAILEGKLFYGTVKTFQTDTVQLKVITVRISDLEEDGVALTGAVQGLPPGGALEDHGFVWSSRSRLPEMEDGQTLYLGASQNNGCFTQQLLMDIPEDTTFYVRSFVVTGQRDPIYGNTLSFRRRGSWEGAVPEPAAPAEIEGSVAFQIDDKIYFGTGDDHGDPTSRFWSFEAPTGQAPRLMPVADFEGAPRAHGVAFSLNGKGYVGTGVDAQGSPLRNFWVFDPAGDGSWSPLTGGDAFPGAARWGAVAFTIGNRAYVGLGADQSGRALDDFWFFEPGAGWSALGATLPGRINAVAFSIEGEGYVGLGITGDNIRLKDFYRYDPESDRWEALEDFPGDARDAAVGFALGGKGYLGLGSSIFGALQDDFWAYNPRRERWKPVKPFEGTPRRYGLAFSLGNAGWVALGTNFFQSVESDFWKLPGDEIEVLGIAEEVCPE